MGHTYIPFVNLTCGPHRLSGPHVSLTKGIIRSAYTRFFFFFFYFKFQPMASTPDNSSLLLD